MSKTNCPAGCGKRFIDAQSADNHMKDMHADWKGPARKGWVTPYGFADFDKPVTYDVACEEMKRIYENVLPQLKKRLEPTRDQ